MLICQLDSYISLRSLLISYRVHKTELLIGCYATGVVKQCEPLNHYLSRYTLALQALDNYNIY